MPTLITSDIHLNEKSIDEVRWGLFPWLRKQIAELQINTLLLLGDATDSKDHHSAVLVNRLIDELLKFPTGLKIYILKGNHDYIDEFTPFFGFVRVLPKVTFISKPTKLFVRIAQAEQPCWFLPSTKNWKEDWQDLAFNDADYIFCHATFEGVLAESGFPLSGIPTSVFGNIDVPIISGDIHSPQKLDDTNIEYVGSPYRTNFGDKYIPRVLYINDERQQHNLYYPCPSKHLVVVRTLRDLDHYKDIKPKDQVKIRVKLTRSEYAEWKTLRHEFLLAATARKWDVCGIELSELVMRKRLAVEQTGVYRTPERVLRDWAEAQRLTAPQVEMGLSLITGELACRSMEPPPKVPKPR